MDLGMAYLYRSKDFKRWIKAKHPLHSSPDTGMWEYPDFYKVSSAEPSSNSTKYILKLSVDEKHFDYYTVGAYERRVDKFFPDNTSLDGSNGLRYDYSNFYASKSFYNMKKSQRVLWGWANESETLRMDKLKAWAGLQTIPRVVSLDPNRKQVIQWPIEEIEDLRCNPIQVINHRLEKGDILRIEPITAAQADLEAVFRLPESLEMVRFENDWISKPKFADLVKKSLAL